MVIIMNFLGAKLQKNIGCENLIQ